MKLRTALVPAAAFAVALSAAAPALAYTLDSDGKGFVAKSEVQIPFGWSNADFQKESTQKSLSFTVETVDTFEAVCEYSQETGRDKVRSTRTSTREKTASVLSEVGFAMRQGKKQVTGINLTGFGTTTESGGTIPVQGTSCPGGNVGDGVWISVTETDSTGGLYATTTASKTDTSRVLLAQDVVPGS